MGQEMGQEQEQRWLGLELEPQQGQPGSDLTCSTVTETLSGWEWGSAWGWACGCSPSLFGRHVRC